MRRLPAMERTSRTAAAATRGGAVDATRLEEEEASGLGGGSDGIGG
jgi:hypothetical protein